MNKKNMLISLFIIPAYMHSGIDLSQEPYKTITEQAEEDYKKEIEEKREHERLTQCPKLQNKLNELIAGLAIIKSESILEKDKIDYFKDREKLLKYADIKYDSDYSVYFEIFFIYKQKEFEDKFNHAINKTMSELTELKCPN